MQTSCWKSALPCPVKRTRTNCYVLFWMRPFYSEEIIETIDSFVRVMSTAIDARSPYNANHLRNMVKYGERFLDYPAEIGYGWQLGEQERRQFLMSVWLHDVGKLVIPLEVMDK